jgi:hypothetical protein
VTDDLAPYARFKLSPSRRVAVKVVHGSALVGENQSFGDTIPAEICFETPVHYVVIGISKHFLTKKPTRLVRLG